MSGPVGVAARRPDLLFGAPPPSGGICVCDDVVDLHGSVSKAFGAVS